MNATFAQSILFRSVSSLLVSLGILLMSVTMVQAKDKDAPDTPDALVSEIFEKVNQELKENEAKIREDKFFLKTLAESLLSPYVSFETMSKQILGKNWRKITPDQRVRYTEAFKNRVSLTMVNQYDPNREYDFKVTGARTNQQGDRAAVATEVVDKSNGTKYNISYKMFVDRQTKNWQVYDVAVEGVSVLQSFKTASAEDFKRNGIEYMIAQLEDGIAKEKEATKPQQSAAN